MWLNYLKTAWRNIIRQKSYSALKLMSLGVGLAVFIYIFLYVTHELSYDKHFSDSEDLRRVVLKLDKKNAEREFFHLMYPLKDALKKDIPQVEHATHLLDHQNGMRFLYDDKEYLKDQVFYADKYFFDVFDYDLIQGNKAQALTKPNTMVISQDFAKTLFGDKNPLNKVIKNKDGQSFKITGVLEELPESTHMPVKVLISMSTFEQNVINKRDINFWFGQYAFPTYVELTPRADLVQVHENLGKVYNENLGYKWEEAGVQAHMYLQPVTDIHLNSHFIDEYHANSDISTVYIFSAVGIFILLIAAFNFINLSTAKSLKRAREVGMRRTMGGSRKQIINQFMGESLLFIVASVILALLLLEIFMPFLNHLAERDLTLRTSQPTFWVVILVIILLTTFLSGTYPALYLSRFSPLKVLSGATGSGKTKNGFRNTLVVIQFVISISLIIGTGVIYKQLQFLNNKDIGYDKEQVVMLKYHKQDLDKKYELIRHELNQLPEVSSASATLRAPVGYLYSEGYYPEGEKNPLMVTTFAGDENYLETMGIALKKGRFFSEDLKTDSASVVINEAFVKELGWDKPIGKIFNRNGRRYKVIGVLENFHFQSLHRPVARMIMLNNPDKYSNMLVRFDSSEGIREGMAKIEKLWNRFEPQHPFEYEFLDRLFYQQYQNDRQFGRMIIYFSLLAIFIACTGLFGLAAFTAEQKTREIGIRKVMGATEKDILKMMITEFTKWVAIAAVLAWPLSWYFMNDWLNTFAYHTDLTPAVFVISAVIALLIASATVALQSWKAARLNPADTVKYE